jgi:hypothetical protein
MNQACYPLNCNVHNSIINNTNMAVMQNCEVGTIPVPFNEVLKFCTVIDIEKYGLRASGEGAYICASFPPPSGWLGNCFTPSLAKNLQEAYRMSMDIMHSGETSAQAVESQSVPEADVCNSVRDSHML